uniref:Uncharacterized protein n=2 Tax=Opuntia streptacantha TaxID=393608 RepID=A0A7C8YJH0_OPUST
MGSIMSARPSTNGNLEMTELRNNEVSRIPGRTPGVDQDSFSTVQRILARARKIPPVVRDWVRTRTTQLKQKLEELERASDGSKTLKLQSSISKLFIAAALLIIGTVVFTPISPASRYAWMKTTEVCIQFTAVLTMMEGIYQGANRSLLARCLHLIGHVLFFEGVALGVSDFLGLSPPIMVGFLISVAVILIAAFLLASYQSISSGGRASR